MKAIDCLDVHVHASHADYRSRRAIERGSYLGAQSRHYKQKESPAMDELSFSRKFVQTFGKDEPIFQEGILGAEMYAVLEGSVAITRRPPEGGETVLRLLGKGEVFGEMGLVENAPRSASARAGDEGAKVMVIDQAKFVYLVSQQPVFALDIMQVLCERIRALEGERADAR